MKGGFPEPEEERSKGSFSVDKIFDLYAGFGFYLEHDLIPSKDVSELEEKYGDIKNELVYLQNVEAIHLDEDLETVTLRESDRKIARRIAESYRNTSNPLQDLEAIPAYLKKAEKIEGKRRKENYYDQEVLPMPEDNEEDDPIEEFQPHKEENLEEELEHSPEIGKLGHVLYWLDNKPRTAREIEDKMVGEPPSNLEWWLRYLETQGVAEREAEDGKKGYSITEYGRNSRLATGIDDLPARTRERSD